jgi:hypothetical protein
MYEYFLKFQLIFDRQDMKHAWEMRLHTKFWSENLMGRHYSVDLGIDGKIILEWI